MVTGLPGAEHPKHQDAAGRLVATGVGMDLVNRTIAPVARQLSCARMLTYGVNMGVRAAGRSPHVSPSTGGAPVARSQAGSANGGSP